MCTNGDCTQAEQVQKMQNAPMEKLPYKNYDHLLYYSDGANIDFQLTGFDTWAPSNVVIHSIQSIALRQTPSLLLLILVSTQK